MAGVHSESLKPTALRASLQEHGDRISGDSSPAGGRRTSHPGITTAKATNLQKPSGIRRKTHGSSDLQDPCQGWLPWGLGQLCFVDLNS